MMRLVRLERLMSDELENLTRLARSDRLMSDDEMNDELHMVSKVGESILQRE